ncbi:MAG TPA: condensation domain-containing protein, partial [Thermoanaerobaculia bacterium]|nr:condensation domain-containing protein [Thermoanaerobaculia bacterium]
MTRSLRERLPEHLVPSVVVGLASLPRTPNGKLDRKALLAVPVEAAGEITAVAPRTPLEELLAGVWAELLGVEQIGVYDSFFALGGHSLLATRLVSRLREVCHVELPLRAVFEQPTVAALAAALERGLSAGDEPPPVRPVPHGGGAPLSFEQERLWFLDQLGPASPLYNIPVAVDLKGPLDVAALGKAFEAVVRRHEILRTVISRAVSGAGEAPWQVAMAAVQCPLPVLDLSALTGAGRREKIERASAQEAERLFDLTASPLWRMLLLRLGPAEHRLVLTFHHTVADEASLAILIREVGTLYGAFAAGRPTVLPELPVQYADYAVWQREWLRGETLDRLRAYWRSRLASAPELLRLPADRPRPALPGPAGAHLRAALPPGLVAGLTTLAREQGVTPFMTFLAAFVALLTRNTEERDLLVGAPASTRSRAELEGLIGFFGNTLVLRSSTAGDPAFLGLLRQVRTACLEAYAHKDLPFARLIEDLRIDHHRTGSALVQVMLAVLDDLAVPPFAGLEARLTPVAPPTAKFDLSLFIQPGSRGLETVLEFSTELFDRSTAERLLGHFEHLLGGIVTDPSRRLSELPLLGEAERRQLLEEWNATAVEYPRESRIEELFAAQAARTPAATALVAGSERLSYGELDHRSNRLAWHLRELGVGPEVLVGVCLERTAELVVALLA